MNEIIQYFKSLFCKQKPEELIAIEMIEARKAFIISEKHRIYQECMSQYLKRYGQFLDGKFLEVLDE